MNRRVHELQQQAVQTMHTTIEEAGRFLRWAASALVVGTIVGGLIGLFRMAVSWAVQMRAAHPAILFALPLAVLQSYGSTTAVVWIQIQALITFSVRSGPTPVCIFGWHRWLQCPRC